MNDDRTGVRNRKRRFLDALLRMPREKAVALSTFVEEAGFELVKDGNDKGSNKLTEKQVRYALKEVEGRLSPYRIRFVGGNISLVREGTPFLRRLSLAAEVKKSLAAALWDLLLGQSWRGVGRGPHTHFDFGGNEKDPKTEKNDGSKEFHAVLLERCLETASESIHRKVESLRSRNQIYFAADAGTTTLAVIEELLTADRVPLSIKRDDSGADDDFSNFGIVEPVLLTNSIPIVQAITDHESHRWTFSVELIGGVVRPGRNCLTGDLSTLFLRACCGLGLVGNLDLVIVGATGVCIGPDGIARAACDDQAEAELKNKLFELAGSVPAVGSGGIRVLVFHSPKLLFPEMRCPFVAISKGMVDLVVIDAGQSDSEKLAVEKFEKCATASGVAVLKVMSLKSGN